MITAMIIVDRSGSNELAAVGLTSNCFYVLLLLGMEIVLIVGVLAAQNFSADNKADITDVVEQGVISAMIMSVSILFIL
jgi:Na+-driven multidrug efflux pump